MILKKVLENKPPGVVVVPPELHISDVVALLAERRIGAVLIVNRENDLVGILSERDIIHGLTSHAMAIFKLTAADLMTRNPMIASPSTRVEAAMEMMTEGHFRHLPVVEHGELLGLVSIGDVVKARLDQHQNEVDSLRAYVAGGV